MYRQDRLFEVGCRRKPKSTLFTFRFFGQSLQGCCRCGRAPVGSNIGTRAVTRSARGLMARKTTVHGGGSGMMQAHLQQIGHQWNRQVHHITTFDSASCMPSQPALDAEVHHSTDPRWCQAGRVMSFWSCLICLMLCCGRTSSRQAIGGCKVHQAAKPDSAQSMPNQLSLAAKAVHIHQIPKVLCQGGAQQDSAGRAGHISNAAV